MTEKKATTRTRNFATVVYLDSAPNDWQDILANMFVPTFISPYHDKDLNATGEEKKPHYHIMMMYDSVKTQEQANENFKKMGGVGCEIINSTRGYARYLCHLDNPEKVQYSIDDVKTLSGADYISAINLITDKYKIMGEMQDFCEKYNVVSFYLLCNYSRKNRSDWYRALCDNSSFYMKEYLKSKNWTNNSDCNKIFDQETGEVIG